MPSNVQSSILSLLSTAQKGVAFKKGLDKAEELTQQKQARQERIQVMDKSRLAHRQAQISLLEARRSKTQAEEDLAKKRASLITAKTNIIKRQEKDRIQALSKEGGIANGK